MKTSLWEIERFDEFVASPGFVLAMVKERERSTPYELLGERLSGHSFIAALPLQSNTDFTTSRRAERVLRDLDGPDPTVQVLPPL